VLARQQEGGVRRRLPLVADEPAENDPRRMIASARERPLPAQPVAAGSPLDLPLGSEARGDLRAAVVAPNLATRFFAEEPHLPDVYAEYTEDPCARTADFADLHLGLVERQRITLVAAEAQRLKPTEQTGLLKIPEGLVG